MKKNDFGTFEITIPAKGGKPAIPHNSKVKVSPAFLTSPLQIVC